MNPSATIQTLISKERIPIEPAKEDNCNSIHLATVIKANHAQEMRIGTRARSSSCPKRTDTSTKYCMQELDSSISALKGHVLLHSVLTIQLSESYFCRVGASLCIAHLVRMNARQAMDVAGVAEHDVSDALGNQRTHLFATCVCPKSHVYQLVSVVTACL